MKTMNKALSLLILTPILNPTNSFLNNAKITTTTITTTTNTKLFSSLEKKTWQQNLDNFLDPFVSPDKKQILLSDLISQNEEIRSSLQSALEERTIDPLLTPKAKQLQDGTRTVSNQIRNDILPQIAKSVSDPSTRKKISPDRIITTTQSQLQKSFEQLSKDLQDPTSIPERIASVNKELLQEIPNIFRSTPEGLKEPPYQLVKKTDEYELRDYETYVAASTSMLEDAESYSFDDAFNSGNGFNTLASYLFGGNKDEKALSMTTPVSITNSGEMRFYLFNDDSTSDSVEDFPSPNEDDAKVSIKKIAFSRLAVSRFTGFVTDGEVKRQKEALMDALKKDGIEIDDSAAAASDHIILQYNPPYTLPVLRRNEIAIPVKIEEEEDDFLYDESVSDDDDVSPSDG